MILQELHLEYTKSLSVKCSEVSSDEEAQVILSSIERFISPKPPKSTPYSASAPEFRISKQVAIIRSPKLNLNLINPKLVDKQEKLISFNESCLTYPELKFNCWRYKKITIENGIQKNLIHLEGIPAMLVQKEIDHLCGFSMSSKTIKMALARVDGYIDPRDLCPCASRDRYSICCMFKEK